MNTIFVERYESLRLFALGRQEMAIQHQNDYLLFIRKGMNAWIADKAIKAPDAPTAEVVFEEIAQKNAFQTNCEPQIMQTIADILFKKIKETPCYC